MVTMSRWETQLLSHTQSPGGVDGEHEVDIQQLFATFRGFYTRKGEGEVKISAGNGEAKMSQSYSKIPYLIDPQLKLSVMLRDVQMLDSTEGWLGNPLTMT
ncbi:hypothetical protein QQ045_009426 [Rhodiola kirilowii]